MLFETLHKCLYQLEFRQLTLNLFLSTLNINIVPWDGVIGFHYNDLVIGSSKLTQLLSCHLGERFYP
jgi:hypothetical protein